LRYYFGFAGMSDEKFLAALHATRQDAAGTNGAKETGHG
jgi:hypothetical protein